MRSIKLFGSILALWLIVSYFLITQLYNKSLEVNHATVANVLTQALLQDTILNDQIKIKASISDFVKSVGDVSFVCMASDGKILSYVGDAEISQREINEKNCLTSNISSNSVSISPIINNHKVPIADLKIFWNQESLSILWFKQNPAIFIGSIILLGLFFLIVKFMFNREQASLLEKSIIELVKNEEPSEYLRGKFPFLSDKWVEMKKTVDMYSNERVKHEKSASIAELASQVSHDIRSPLSALTMLMNNINELPENKRILARNSIQRINDIANCLIEKSKTITKASSSDLHIKEQGGSVIELVPAILDTIISEKRLQFRDHIGVEIESELRDSYGAFAKINSLELKRVISNLINNAIEALPEQKGQIVTSISSKSDSVNIVIKDNGMGIPRHILDRLGEKGITHGKEGTSSGSGLGIYHAKKTIEELGGQFIIETEIGRSTTITISLPKAPSPFWFVDKIEVNSGLKLVICDDDLSIHQIWTGRIKSLFGEKIETLSFTNGDLFKKWLKENENTNYLCLVDFELINQLQTGLDIIEELLVQKNAILVTSRYEEQHIKTRCEKLNLRIIPKMMVGYVPIKIIKPKKYYDACLIDDDFLMKLSWELAAKENGTSIRVFESYAAFLEASNDIDPKTPIYIDVNLGNGVKGTDVAVKISNIGFKELYLATGYDASMVESVPSCILEVRGKDPIFANTNISDYQVKPKSMLHL